MATLESPDVGYRPGSNPGSSYPDVQASSRSTDDLKHQVKDEVRHLASEAKEGTSRMAGQAGDMVQGLLGKQKDQTVERLDGVAGALRDVGNRLQQEDGAGFGQYAVRAAEQVDRFSGYLRDRDLKTFVRDTEGFARRHPDVFLGGTFVAGLVLARFLKSSSASREDGPEGGDRSPYGSTSGVVYPDTPEGA